MAVEPTTITRDDKAMDLLTTGAELTLLFDVDSAGVKKTWRKLLVPIDLPNFIIRMV